VEGETGGHAHQLPLIVVAASELQSLDRAPPLPVFSAHTEGSCPELLGEPEAFIRIVNIPAQITSEVTTVSFLIDEHETPAPVGIWGGIGAFYVLCHVVAGNEGRQQEGEERDLGEHVFGVDSAKLLWFAVGTTTVRMGSQDKERGVGLRGGDRRLLEHVCEYVDRLYAIEGC